MAFTMRSIGIIYMAFPEKAQTPIYLTCGHALSPRFLCPGTCQTWECLAQ